MPKFLLLVISLLFLFGFTYAQQRLPQKQMTFLSTSKPNSIFYNDTFYNGSKSYGKLFYGTKDAQIIEFYKKHQSDKIIGSAMGTIGSVALAVGVIYAGGNHNNISRGTGWIMAGAGLASAITGGYLMSQSTSNLLVAVYLFNKRYANPKAAVGISGNGASFVLKF